MPAAIFNGQFVKVLKDEIKSKSGGLFDKVFTSAKSTNFTAEVGFTYLINTGTAVTVTLPAVSANAAIVFKDSTGGAGANAITIKIGIIKIKPLSLFIKIFSIAGSNK